MVALFAASIITWLFGAKGTIPFAYGSVTVRQLLVSMLVVTVGIYAYQRSLEQLVGQKEESQRDLQSEKVRADEIVKHIGEGIVTTDAAGTVTFANDPAQKLLGWKIEELKGKSFVETVPMQDEFGGVIPAERRPLRRAIRAGETTVTMATYRSKDGRAIPVSVTATPVIVEDRVIGAIGTFRDITEEQAIARAKSEFVTLASHQLRTPISAISWVSELLLSGDAGKLSSEQHEHIAGIYQSNQRMAALVSEMLMVSSLELGTLSITPEQTDLAALAAKTLKERLSSQSSSNRAQEVTERYDPDLPAVPCDPEATKLVFNNLISNALKYTPSTGRITLELAVDRHEKLHAGSNGSIVFRISDTGYGIPEKVTDKIFSKFFRADNIVHKDTDGTGLGLYIVKALLDYVGGRVSFTSRENQGTTFTVLIPLEGMARRQPGQSQAASSVAKAAHA
jgi:PAS domain S-box-containing protein